MVMGNGKAFVIMLVSSDHEICGFGALCDSLSAQLGCLILVQFFVKCDIFSLFEGTCGGRFNCTECTEMVMVVYSDFTKSLFFFSLK